MMAADSQPIEEKIAGEYERGHLSGERSGFVSGLKLGLLGLAVLAVPIYLLGDLLHQAYHPAPKLCNVILEDRNKDGAEDIVMKYEKVFYAQENNCREIIDYTSELPKPQR